MNTWLEIRCPACDKRNFVSLGDLSDLTVADETGFRCWWCRKDFEFDEEGISQPSNEEQFLGVQPIVE